jgi:hypothetical protein
LPWARPTRVLRPVQLGFPSPLGLLARDRKHGRGARATQRGGEPARGISGRRAHRSSLFVVGKGGIDGGGRTRQAGVGVAGIDGWVGEQHTAGAELVGGSARLGSGRGKLTLAWCSVADRAGGGKLVGGGS